MLTCVSLPVMQLKIDDQIVTCDEGSVSRKVCNSFAECCEVGEKRNAVRGPSNVTIDWARA